MARTHARLKLSIWDDKTFCALDPDIQAVYLMLTAYKSLSFCGVLDYIPKRLVKFSAAMTVDRLHRAILRLCSEGFMELDEEEDELLIRSYIRNDDVLKMANVAKGMVSAYQRVRSPYLRDVIVHELARLWEEDPDMKGWGGVKDVAPDLLEEVREWTAANPEPNPSANPSRYAVPDPSPDPGDNPEPNPSAKGCATPLAFDLKPLAFDLAPEPLSLAPEPLAPEPENQHPCSPPAANGSADRRPLFEADSEPKPERRRRRRTKAEVQGDPHPGFEQFWYEYPRKQAKGDGAWAYEQATWRAAPEVLNDAAAALADDPNLPANRTKIPLAATWLNGDRWNDGPYPEDRDRPAARTSTTDERVGAVADRRRIYQEAAAQQRRDALDNQPQRRELG